MHIYNHFVKLRIYTSQIVLALITAIFSIIVAQKDHLKMDEPTVLNFNYGGTYTSDHQDLFYQFSKFWIHIFGNSNFALRGFSIILLILSIQLIFHWVKTETKKTSVATYSSLILLLNPHFLDYFIYSYEYSIYVTISLLSFIFFFQTLDYKKGYLALFITNLCGIYVFTMFYNIWFLQLAFIIFGKNFSKAKKIFTVSTLLAISFNLIAVYSAFKFRIDRFSIEEDTTIITRILSYFTDMAGVTDLLNPNYMNNDLRILFLIIISIFIIYSLKNFTLKSEVKSLFFLILIYLSFLQMWFLEFFIGMAEILYRYIIYLTPVLSFLLANCFLKEKLKYGKFWLHLYMIFAIGNTLFFVSIQKYRDKTPLINHIDNLILTNQTSILYTDFTWSFQNLVRPIYIRNTGKSDMDIKFYNLNTINKDLPAKLTIAIQDLCSTNTACQKILKMSYTIVNHTNIFIGPEDRDYNYNFYTFKKIR